MREWGADRGRQRAEIERARDSDWARRKVARLVAGALMHIARKTWPGDELRRRREGDAGT